MYKRQIRVLPERVERIGQVGALAEAHAVLLALVFVEDHRAGEVGVARTFADHRARHQRVNHASIGRARSHFHQRRRLGFHLNEIQPKLLDLSLARRARFDREAQPRKAVRRLILSSLVRRQHHNLRIQAVGLGGRHARFHLVGQRHAVPNAVDRLGVKLHDLVVPVDFNKLGLYAQRLGKRLRHIRVKADPLTGVILVVHRRKVGDANHQRALILDVRRIAAVRRLCAVLAARAVRGGIRGTRVRSVVPAAARGKGHHHHRRQEQRKKSLLHCQNRSFPKCPNFRGHHFIK